MLPVAALSLTLAIAASVGYILIRSDYDRQASAASGPCGYKIAFLGATARPGPAIRAAAGLAVDQFNTVNPKCTVELVGFDTFRDPVVSETRAKEIASDAKIVGVVGPLGEQEAQGALPVLDRANVATISPMLTEDSLAELGWRVFHRTVGAILGDDTPTGIRYLTRELKATKTFVIDEGDDDSVATTRRARKLLGDAFVGSASIHSLESDLARVVDQVSNSGADSVYYAGYGEVMVPLLRELRAEKPDITFLAGKWGYNDGAVAELGSAAEGIYATNPGMALSQADRAFVEQIKTISPTAVNDDDRSSEAYDAANILLSGLAAGKTSRTEMLTWVRNFNGTGVSGPIRFKPNGNRTSVPVHLGRVVDGSWKTVRRISGGKGTA